jgi:CheY-like chemotaxis protein
MKVLFVDDDVEEREFFVDALSYVAPAVECILAKDCEHALAVLEETSGPPHYIFLDINMPGIDGRTCLTKLRKDQRYQNIKVVMYSANSEPSLMEEYKALGATYFLIKPATFSNLCDSLSILFDK